MDITTANYGEGDVSVLLNYLPVMPVMVSAASYSSGTAPCSIVSIYGIGLASTVAIPSQTPPAPLQQTMGCVPPLDTSLAGTSVFITDSTRTQTTLALLYVSPTQTNAIVPAGVATGPGTFTATATMGYQTAAVTVTATAPEIFTANATGMGVPAAQFIPDVVSPTNIMNVYTCSTGEPPPNTCTPVPIDPSSGASVLVLLWHRYPQPNGALLGYRDNQRSVAVTELRG